jgi:hypothetical protein
MLTVGRTEARSARGHGSLGGASLQPLIRYVRDLVGSRWIRNLLGERSTGNTRYD